MKKLFNNLLIIILFIALVLPVSYTAPVNAAASPNSLHTVLFDTQGGSEHQVFQVVNGSSIAYLPIPTRTNYKFKGWYTSTTYKTEFLPTTPVFRDTTIYAKWDYFVNSGTTTNEGWENIENEILSLSKGKSLNIEMNTSVLPKRILSAIQGKDIYLVLTFTFYTWTIHGTDIITPQDTDFGITTNQLMYTYYPSEYDLLDNLHEQKLELTLSSKTNLPNNSQLNVLVNKENEEYYVSLFRMNDDEQKYELQESSVIDIYGYTKLNITQPTDYVLLITEFLPAKVELASNPAPTIAKSFTISRWEELDLKSEIKNLGQPIVTAFTSADPQIVDVSFYKGLVSPSKKGKTTVYIQIDRTNKTYYLKTAIIVK